MFFFFSERNSLTILFIAGARRRRKLSFREWHEMKIYHVDWYRQLGKFQNFRPQFPLCHENGKMFSCLTCSALLQNIKLRSQGSVWGILSTFYEKCQKFINIGLMAHTSRSKRAEIWKFNIENLILLSEKFHNSGRGCNKWGGRGRRSDERVHFAPPWYHVHEVADGRVVCFFAAVWGLPSSRFQKVLEQQHISARRLKYPHQWDRWIDVVLVSDGRNNRFSDHFRVAQSGLLCSLSCVARRFCVWHNFYWF